MAVNIARLRFRNQGLGPGQFDDPPSVAAYMGALQAQDRPSMLWALGIRCAKAGVGQVEQAFHEKRLVRTWLLRGTLHVAAAEDVRWMLALLSPRLKRRSTRRWRELALDAETLARGQDILVHALRDGQSLTRAQLFAALEAGGVSPAGQRGYHILRAAALDQLICFGPRRGNEPAFVLIDNWATQAKRLDKESALAELARRYFRSHGPATLADFVWWSGLTTGLAREGLAAARPDFEEITIGGETYWMPPITQPSQSATTAALLPAYDEYYLGYKNREAMLNPHFDKNAVSSGGVFRPTIVIDGQIVGVWQMARTKGGIPLEPKLFRSLTAEEERRLARAARRYGAFLGRDIEII